MKILMVEDDPEIIESLNIIIDLRWPEATLLSTSNGERGIDLVKNENPDLVILDLGLPDTDGFQVLREVRAFSEVPVVILTVRGEEINKIKGLELGADDYVVKPFSPGEFLARLKAVTRRVDSEDDTKNDYSRPFIRHDLRVDLATHEVSVGNKPVKMSPRVYRLLEVLIQNIGSVVSKEILMDVVKDPGEAVSDTLLDKLIDRLRLNIGDNPKNPIIIIKENDTGYKFVD